MNIQEFAREVHRNAVEHGWWDKKREIAEIVALRIPPGKARRRGG